MKKAAWRVVLVLSVLNVGAMLTFAGQRLAASPNGCIYAGAMLIGLAAVLAAAFVVDALVSVVFDFSMRRLGIERAR